MAEESDVENISAEAIVLRCLAIISLFLFALSINARYCGSAYTTDTMDWLYCATDVFFVLIIICGTMSQLVGDKSKQ